MSAGADWSDCRSAAERHLADTSAVAALLLGRDRRVERANGAFLRMVGSASGLCSDVLADLLTPASLSSAERLLSATSSGERLQFKGDGGSVFLLDCRAYAEGERLLLLGEGFTPVESEVLRNMTRLHGEVVNLSRELERKNRELEHALAEIKALHGFLPTCMYCRRIRGDDGKWQRLEDYVTERSTTRFSQCLCPECFDEHWPEAKPR